jgi:hypothetical protein
MDGFIPLYWDEPAGRLYLEIPRMDEELIYNVSLPWGLGSNDVGLDRGQLGGERVVHFERVGPKVLMVQPNYAYRSLSGDSAQAATVQESFARSVLWGFTAVAETGGRVLVDGTDFALRDAHGVVPALRRARQGSFKLDASRSALYPPNTKAFPRNSEIEVTLTFTADSAGSWVRDVTPTPEAVTVRERQSFIALPPPGYTPRPNDPRAGYFGIEYRDLTAPLGAPVTKRFIARHRLERKDPGAAVSEPVEPIVYYLDRGVPEPMRSALLEGANWWGKAFEAAGFRDAFRVEPMPDSVDPMDVRYNVIQWVHRATRGWSYGASVTDPRTGEIIQGHVTLGSLRARQDYLIAEGLLSPYATGTETPPALQAMVLGRLRQLAAHEVGHTLGLAHNYIASSYPHGSVMDYPHPAARLTADGRIDLSDAYDVGIGGWDSVAIRYGYEQFPAGTDVPAALDGLLRASRLRGVVFLTDQDARPTGSTHPETNLWDLGRSAAGELRRITAVRDTALSRFGEAAIRRDRPLATMEEALVPVYLFHRYQIEATAKTLAGEYYTYAMRGDEQQPLRPVPPVEQQAALDALLATLAPSELTIPRSVLAKLPPRPYTYDPHRELFDRYTGITFDAVTPAVVLSGLTVSLLLQPERAARLVEQHALDPGQLGLGQVIDQLERAVFDARTGDGYQAAVNRASQRVVVDELMRLAYGAPMPEVRAVASMKLEELRRRLARPRGDDVQRAHEAALAADIRRFLERPYEPARPSTPLDLPPGAPIGEAEPDWLNRE